METLKVTLSRPQTPKPPETLSLNDPNKNKDSSVETV